MGFYIPSFIQKRILRYALSKLDVLDTEALDLESLGITWGKRSALELRDVGLRLDRLSALLHLPDFIVLRNAKIRLLRLTIPADIHTSSIVCEVEGIYLDVSVNAASKDHINAGAHEKRHRENLQDGTHTDKETNGTASEDPAGTNIPTTANLAQSFVDTESAEEKAQLRAAVAKSFHVEAPALSDSFEDGVEEGYGAPLSLPWFVADFLHGIKARFKASINDVQLDVSVKVDLSAFGSTNTSGDVEDIKLRLSIASLDIPPCVEATTSQDKPKNPDANNPQAPGRRKVSVRDIRMILLSDSSVLSFMSGLSGPPSPSTTYSTNFKPGDHKRQKPSSSPISLNSTQEPAPSQEKDDFIGEDHTGSDFHRVRISSGDDYWQATLDQPTRTSSPMSSSRKSHISGSKISSHGSDTYISTVAHSASAAESTAELPGSSSPDFEIYELPSDHPDTLTASTSDRVLPRTEATAMERESRDGSGDSSPDADLFHSIPYVSQHQHSSEDLPEAVHEDSENSFGYDDDAQASEDLTKSRLFSHEEAASMYQSAISQAALSSAHGGDNGLDSKQAPERAAGDLRESNNRGIATPAVEAGLPPPRPSQSSAGQLRGVADGRNPSVHPETPVMSPSKAEVSSSIHKKTRIGSSDDLDQLPSQSNLSSQTPNTGFIAKEFFAIAMIAVEYEEVASLQQGEDKIEENVSGASHSTHHIPGGFSESMISVGGSVYNPGQPKPRVEKVSKSDVGTKAYPRKSPIQIHAGSVNITSDMGLISLVVLLIQQMPLKPSSEQPPSNESAPSASADVEIKIERFCVAFVSELKGIWQSNLELKNSPPIATEQDILLELMLGQMSFSQSISESIVTRQIAIKTFTFGYKNESILSFDSSLRMRESIRDTLSPTGCDITISITTRAGAAPEVVIMTLPLHIKLNLTRLDETFSWMGGLSGILELSSSMISTVTITDPSAKTRQTKSARPARNVRFASPTPRIKPMSKNEAVPAKITARVGGLAFDLISSQSVITIEGTAVKIARRGNAVRVNVDRLNLKGPILMDSQTSPAITLTFELVKLVHLQSPDEDDLDRLLALLAPSRDYEESTEDILLETFLRQRRQGTILRANVQRCHGSVLRTKDLESLNVLLSELKKLAPMAKYIPEDDRPGLLLLSRIESLNFQIETDHALGRISLQATDTEFAHVSLPSIVLLGIGSFKVWQANKELAGAVIEMQRAVLEDSPSQSNPPMVHARFIGNEMEPTMKIKLWNLRLEYHISTVMAILGLQETAGGEVVVAELVNSVAALTSSPSTEYRTPLPESSKKTESEKPMKFELVFRNSALGLNPRGSLARGLLHLTNVSFLGGFPDNLSGDMHGTLTIQKMSLLIIDDSTLLGHLDSKEPATSKVSKQDNDQLKALTNMGYACISEVSTASITVKMFQNDKDDQSVVEVVIKDDLIVLETCADSTQTFISILNGLQPPMPPKSELKYRTEVVPVQDMIATLSGDDFAVYEEEADDVDYSTSLEEDGDHVDDDVPENLDFVESFYNPNVSSSSVLMDEPDTQDATIQKHTLPSFHERPQVMPGYETLDYQADHFADKGLGADNTRRWSSKKNAYEPVSNLEKVLHPFKLSLQDVHLIWNLYDGYDWQRTRDTISQAVAEVESKAADLQARRRRSRSLEDDDESDPVIEDFLFNSIYIGVGTNQSPRDLTRNINKNIDDLISEAESYSTTTGTSLSPSPNRQGTQKPRRSKLRLHRSRHHKMTFELKGLNLDFRTLPPGSGETQSSVDLKVRDLDIFDHVPTSTWKKFATYMHDAGERESGTYMIRIEILNVKPVPDLAASEMIFKASVLPLRLHVDQDALDFLTRFFEFKDDRESNATSASEAPFIQRAEINSIPVKLDFKPKRVDYAGLRSGQTTEFMNFMILDAADMVMRHVIIYGVSGFDRLGKTLNDIWMPDIRRNQLPGVLAGLAPIRPLVNVGSGVRDLVVIPMREYRKDGRVIRSIQKGALAFAKTTTAELAKLGAKLAVGTHTALQSAEEVLAPQSAAAGSSLPPDTLSDSPPEERTTISPYAELPIGVVQGLRGAYRQLERDLLLARDAIVAMPGEVMESGSAQGAAKAFIRGAPTVILRPALGVTKAVGQTLMGAATTLDRDERRRIEEKYKRH